MVPILFESTETAFTSNGVGRLADCLSCVVTEERNGIYECVLTYPINGKWYSRLIQGGIVGVIHDDNHDIQPFDIYKYSAPINGIVTFYASHISYRLNDILVSAFSATSASDAMTKIGTNSVNTNPFTFTTDYTGAKDYNLGFMRNARGVLMGEEGSMLQSWHGEYLFDKFNVSLLQHRGSDTGVTVRYGKNITDITKESDWSGTFNAIAPYWTDGSLTVTLPEVYVQPTTPITPLKIAVMDFSTAFENMPTVAQLRAAAVAYLDANKPWMGFNSIEIDFVALWQTPEYEDVAEIQRVGLCDTVSVYWTDAGIVSEKIKVVRTEFNVLTERYDRLHLGESSTQYVAIENGSGGNPQPEKSPVRDGTVTKTFTGTFTNDSTFLQCDGHLALLNLIVRYSTGFGTGDWTDIYSVSPAPLQDVYFSVDFNGQHATVRIKTDGAVQILAYGSAYTQYARYMIPYFY